jgi:succinate dehydrogenase/fumarate reductase flavoprotein subunit
MSKRHMGFRPIRSRPHELIYRPLRHPDGPPQPQVEYKLRRFVNDYVAPPKTAAKLSLAVQTFERMRDEVAGIGATTPHELLRAVEVSFIRDCAEMAARSSLTRTESRWGPYHYRSDLPDRDDVDWRYHLNLRWAASEATARDALTGALEDGDADVRAYARQALATSAV